MTGTFHFEKAVTRSQFLIRPSCRSLGVDLSHCSWYEDGEHAILAVEMGYCSFATPSN